MAAEAVQKSAEWIPLAQSAVVGLFALAGSFGAQWWAIKRDLRNRAADALERRAQKRVERQIEALLGLQDAAQGLLLHSFGNLTLIGDNGSLCNIDYNELLKITNSNMILYAEFRKLQSRIDSKEVYAAADEFLDMEKPILTSENIDTVDANKKMAKSIEKLNHEIRRVLLSLQ